MCQGRNKGFTLIELMIVVAVIGILAMIAYPSYESYLLRSRRADAQQLMLDIETRQKQLLIEQRAYAQAIGATNVASTGWTCTNAATIPGSCTNLYYTVTFDPAVDNTDTPPSYVICAAPKSGSRQVPDGVLTLTSTGAKMRRTGTSCTAGTDQGW
jgi:type IV pilus assembly protein PilE